MSLSFRRNDLNSKSEVEAPRSAKKVSREQPEKQPLLLVSPLHSAKDDLQMPIKAEEGAEAKSEIVGQTNSTYCAEATNENKIQEESEQNNKTGNLSIVNIKIQDQQPVNPLKILKCELLAPSLMSSKTFIVPSYSIVNHANLQEVSVLKVEADPEGPSFIRICQQSTDETDWHKKMKERALLFCLMNSFRSFQQATAITSYSLTLANKGPVHRLYLSILKVLIKENNKMAIKLNQQKAVITNSLQKIDQKSKVKFEEEEPTEAKKYLQGTKIYGKKVEIKIEMVAQELPNK